MAETFYNSIDSEGVGSVDFQMFKKAIIKDKSLLEFFSMIITGMSDGFIQKNIERLKLQIFLNKINTIQNDVQTVKELMNELITHLPPEFKLSPKNMDHKIMKKSALFYELKSLGETRKRREISQKIDKKHLDDDGDLINPPSIKEIKLAVQHTDEINSPKAKLKDISFDEDSQEEGNKVGITQLKPVAAIPVDSFEGNSEDLDKMEPIPNKPFQKKTISDNMIATPKLNKIVGNRFLRKSTIQNSSSHAEAADDASITRQIVNKLNAVFAKLDTLKHNLSDNEGAIKDQIGSRMAIDVKKNMGVAATQSKNKLLFILHDSWAVMASMMMGIQKSTNSLLNQNFALKDSDFKMQYTFELRPAQVSSKDNEIDAYSKSIFYDYAPYVFKEIRQLFNISSKSVACHHPVPQLPWCRRSLQSA